MPKAAAYLIGGLAAGIALSKAMQPDMPELEEPPTASDPEVRARKDTQRRVMAAKQGYKSTILTNQLGGSLGSGTSGKTTLG